MKRFLIFLATTLTMVLLSMVLTSCALPNANSPHTHSVSKVFERASTCSEQGNIEHYVCSCGKYFADSNSTTEITDISLPLDSSNHEQLNSIDAKPASCVSLASISYFECPDCFNIYSDENGEYQLSESDIYYGEYGTHSNVELEEGEKATCSSYGVLDCYICNDCERLFLDQDCMKETYYGAPELVINYDYSNHTYLTFNQGVEPDCLNSGIKDYYTCDACYRMYEDEQAFKEIFSYTDLYLEPTQHNVTYYPERQPLCSNDYIGNMAYYYCSSCGRNYDSPYGYYEILETGIYGNESEFWCHTLEYVPEQKQTCVQDGNRAHYLCDCGVCFDENYWIYPDSSSFYDGMEKNEWSHSIVYLAARQADCSPGNIECMHCEFCDKYYSLDVDIYYPTDDYMIPKTQAVIPANGNHKLKESPYLAPTCSESGSSAYWQCESCLEYFRDEAGLNVFDQSLIPLAPTGHRWEHHQAKASSCKEQGNIAYSHCTKCNKDFNLYASPIEDVTGRTSTGYLPHRTTFIAGVEPTCTETGLKDRYSCSTCSKKFEDEDAMIEIIDIVIPEKGHSFSSGWKSDGNGHWHESICGHNVISEIIPHNNNGTRLGVASTCKTHGYNEIYCTECLAPTGTAELPLEGHKYSNLVERKEPNCFYEGVLAHYTCLTCDNWFDENYVLKSKSELSIPVVSDAHSYKYTTTESTCQTQGATIGKCEYCTDEKITYKPLVSCSYGMIALDTYYHAQACKWCKEVKGVKSYHFFDSHYTCTTCKEDYDYTENIQYFIAKESGSSIYYAYIEGMLSGYSVPSVLKIPTVLEGCEVRNINGYAFNKKTSLKEVYVPEKVNSIGNYTFQGCTSLEMVYFIGESELVTVAQFAFDGCTKLSKFVMPKTVKYVKESAFRNTAIEYVEFYNLDSTIGMECISAFENCKSLELVYFYDTCPIKYLPDEMFKGCTALKDVRLNSSLLGIHSGAFRNCSSLQDIVIPEEVTFILDYAFYGAFDKNLDLSITIPESVNKVGTYAFAHGGLSEVYLLGFTTYENFDENSLLSNGSSAFATNSKLERVVVGEKVEVLSFAMFSSCAQLEEIEFRNSENIKYFGDACLRTGTLLDITISIDEEVQYFGNKVFSVDDSGKSHTIVSFKDYSNLKLYNTTTKTYEYAITSQELLDTALNTLLTSGSHQLVTEEYLSR